MQVSAVLTKGARRLHPTTAENAGVHIQGVGGGGGKDGQTKIYNTKVILTPLIFL